MTKGNEWSRDAFKEESLPAVTRALRGAENQSIIRRTRRSRLLPFLSPPVSPIPPAQRLTTQYNRTLLCSLHPARAQPDGRCESWSYSDCPATHTHLVTATVSTGCWFPLGMDELEPDVRKPRYLLGPPLPLVIIWPNFYALLFVTDRRNLHTVQCTHLNVPVVDCKAHHKPPLPVSAPLWRVRSDSPLRSGTLFLHLFSPGVHPRYYHSGQDTEHCSAQKRLCSPVQSACPALRDSHYSDFYQDRLVCINGIIRYVFFAYFFLIRSVIFMHVLFILIVQFFKKVCVIPFLSVYHNFSVLS